MDARPFRFGLVAAEAPTGAAWSALARRAEELGFGLLLVPDRVGMLAPGPAVAAAATATTTIGVGTFVLAAGTRTPAAVAWEARTLATLADGRFTLGLGAGHPRVDSDVAALGMPPTTPGGRVAALEETVRLVREAATADRPAPPLLAAAGGPRMLALAGRLADTVALGLPPTAGEAQLAEAARAVRSSATDARRPVPELSNNLLAVGTETPPWLARHIGTDVATLAAGGAVAVLTGSVAEMADRLVRRRDEIGVSLVTINSGFAEAMAPVVERLAGT